MTTSPAFRSISLTLLLALSGGILWLSEQQNTTSSLSLGIPRSAVLTTGGATGANPQSRSRATRTESTSTSRLALIVGQFERALARRPTDTRPLRQLAAELESVDRAKGLDAYRQLTQAYPGDTDVWLDLGTALHRAGDNRTSMVVLEQALKLEPAHAGVKVLRGRLYATGSPPRVQQALGEWRDVLQDSPDAPEALEAARLLQLYEGR